MEMDRSSRKTPEHVRRTNAARTAAVKRLIAAYPDEWKQIYAEEASSRGVSPRSSNIQQRIAQLESKIAELKARSDA
jgi:uncharacterized protein YceH (UPF0502 family)